MRKIQHTLVKFPIVDAGGKDNELIAAQIGGLYGKSVNESNVPALGDGLHQLFGVSVVVGIVDDSCFHSSRSSILRSLK